jgi:SAM-dependent methyltransferase
MSALISALEEVYMSRIRGYWRTRLFIDRLRKPIIPASIYESTKKLNLGSSCRPLPSYLNVDALADFNPDIVCDIRKLDFAIDNEYDLVRASHVLEHFAFEEIPNVLAEWRRVLKVGGYLVVCVPDYIALSWRAILKPSRFDFNDKAFDYGWLIGLYALNLPPEFRHQTVFTRKGLTGLLNKAGFKILGKQVFRVEHPFTLGIMDDSCNLLSLNVVAQKI